MGVKESGLVRQESAPPLRRSIEVEYWVIDDQGALTEPGDLVEAAAGVEREFVEPLLEIKTPPCETPRQLRRELVSRLERVRQRAETQDKHLVPLATPAHAGSITDLPSERTRIQDRVVGENFEYVRHCAGTHVHLEQHPDREIDQLNTLIALDPALALVNSSPYFEDSVLAPGARSQLYRWMAYEGLPRQGTLWPYATDRKEWARRYERGYGEFLTEAIIAGCDRETVTDCFDPENAVWTPIKLRSEFSTVEWRSPDTALPSQVLRLADDIAGILERVDETPVRIEGERGHVTDDAIVLPEFHTVQHHVETAITEGLPADDLRAYLDRMGFDVDTYDPLTHEFDRETLTREQARDLRLTCADRLETDIDRLTTEVGRPT